MVATGTAEPKYAGWKYYNSETVRGRTGATLITWGACFGIFCFFKIRSKLNARREARAIKGL